MADGSTRKLRFVEFGKNPALATFQWGAAPGGMLLSDFSAESRAFLDAIRDGRIKLLKTPGLSALADFPAGPVRHDPLFYQRVGVLRDWTRLDGRKVQACMINLNDEVVSLVIGEKVWNLATSDLSDTDLRYLDEVKAGRERTVPLIVPLTGYPWAHDKELIISANGHQVIGEPANDRRFEEALTRVIAMVGAKLDKACWEFHELRELEVTKPPAGNGWELLAPADPAEFPTHTVFYKAVFRLTPQGRTKAAGIWPHSVSPVGWEGSPELVIDLAPNAEFATVRLIGK